jgi:hypothetical protein
MPLFGRLGGLCGELRHEDWLNGKRLHELLLADLARFGASVETGRSAASNELQRSPGRSSRPEIPGRVQPVPAVSRKHPRKCVDLPSKRNSQYKTL